MDMTCTVQSKREGSEGLNEREETAEDGQADAHAHGGHLRSKVEDQQHASSAESLSLPGPPSAMNMDNAQYAVDEVSSRTGPVQPPQTRG
jgi:hypothetical protein